MEFFTQNWAELLLLLGLVAKTITRLTPGIKDDEIFGYIDRLINAIVPNNE
tara:strand:+ start:1833 stop:1985 length:153 start_codon:yes stop_codon:yes gene_type:complete